jgi:hypothetical protein
MADYLTKLASRALGVALTAQPVASSIFAPEPPVAAALSSAWREPLREDGSDNEALGLPPIPPQAVRRAPAGPAAARGPTDLVGADAAMRSEGSPFPVRTAEPDARSSGGWLLSPVGQETERRPASRAGQPGASELSGQASPAATQAGAGAVQRQADAAAYRNAAAPDTSAPALLADAPRTASLASNVRTTQQSLHGPSGGTSGMSVLDAGVIEARPAPSAERTAAQAELPANRPAPEASPDRVTVTRGARMVEAGPAAPTQRADAGADSAGFGLLLPADSEQAPGRSPGTMAHGAVRQQAASPPAPVIEVIIGRVDVRAVQADRQAGKPKSAAPSGPPLSLEAYLRQQQGNQP